MRPIPSHAARLHRGASPAVLAAMLALQPQVAKAQAFQGTPTVIFGTVTRQVGANVETLTAFATQNTINWIPNDSGPGPAPINFLPAGTVATFQAGDIATPYTVLNRIIAADQSRAIQFAGAVNSDARGRIWFYAPGGLLLSDTARFNVGSLLLTANDPVGAAAGQPYLDAVGNFRLTAAPDSQAGITVQAGAQINAPGFDSYVIAVAPKFDMAGSITVNGSAALAAVEDASFTLNGGLFDISTTVGSAAGGTSSITGTITGPGGIGGQGVFHRIYLMAVPKNDAMTLLISGGAQIGFDIATSADVAGNAIILSGGYDVTGNALGEGVGQFGQLPVSSSAGAALVAVDNASFTSNVTIRSKDRAEVQAIAGPLDFARNLDVFADGFAIVRARSGQVLNVAGDLSADASTYANLFAGASRAAGLAEVSASGGGTLLVQGRISALAIGEGEGTGSPGLAGGTGTGGTAFIGAIGGAVRASRLLAAADGIGGASFDGNGGTGTGGFALVQLDGDGSFTLQQDIRVFANGIGDIGGNGRQSGSATGGTASALIAAPLALQGNLVVAADATYVERVPTSHLGGGIVQGGTADVTVQPGASLAVGQIAVSAAGLGALGAGGNAYLGGTAELVVRDTAGNTSVTAPGGLLIDASARAADGVINANADGGSATAGLARLLALGNPQLAGFNGVRISALATGGNGAGGIGGAARGGQAHLDLQNGGSLVVNNQIDLLASAVGGSGTIGGDATAFDAGDGQPPAVFLRLGPNAAPSDQGIQVGGNLGLDATATAGSGSIGNGGAARGGLLSVRVDSGSLGAAIMAVNGTAQGGEGRNGGAARGGRLAVRLTDASMAFQTQFSLETRAIGGNALGGDGGRGGDATTGQATLLISSLENGNGASLTSGAMTILSGAFGGNGGSSAVTGGAGGDAFGIEPNAPDNNIVVGIQPARSAFLVGQLFVENTSTGGAGGLGIGSANGGSGGNARGGAVNVGMFSGPVTPTANQSTANFGASLVIDGRVTGGVGGDIDGSGLGGRGGDATGAIGTLLARGGSVIASTVTVDTSATGGNAGAGIGDLGAGNATGGTSGILATPHFEAGLPADVNVNLDVTLLATARGGQSQVGGGTGRGGTARIELKRHEEPGAAPAATAGVLTLGGLVVLDSSGSGGDGVGAGNGGNGFGGTSLLFNQAGTSLYSDAVTLLSQGTGGIKGAAGLLTGNGNGGEAQVTLDGGLMTLAGDLNASSRGQLGSASGGGVRLTTSASGGSLLLNGGTVTLNARAESGDGFEFGPSQESFGGGIIITAGAGSLLRIRQPGGQGTLTIAADADVRNLSQFSTTDAFGGGIRMTADGRLEVYGGDNGLTVSATTKAGDGGAALAGGEAFGGGIEFVANTGGSILFDPQGQVFRVVTTAIGGDSGISSGTGGGSGIRVNAAGGTIAVAGSTSIEFDGFAGNGAPGGDGSGSGVRLSFDAGGTLAFGGALSLAGRGSGVTADGGAVRIESATGGTFSVAGDLNANLDAFFATPANGIALFGGFLGINSVASSLINVAGNLNLSANALNLGPGNGSTLFGGGMFWNHRGTATIQGSVIAALRAEYGDGAAGTADGGSATINALAGVLTTGGLDVSATASAGFAGNGLAFVGTGGGVTLGTAAGAELNINGGVTLDVGAVGSATGSAAGGTGQGGTITITNAGITRLNVADAGLLMLAQGFGGDGGQGGTGRGGTIALSNAAGGRLAITGAVDPLELIASGEGGFGTLRGGSGIGGTINVTNAGDLALPGGLSLLASGISGDGSAAGDATGGTASIAQSGGTAQFVGNLVIDSRAVVQPQPVSGDGTGGAATVNVTAGTFDVSGNMSMLVTGSGRNATGGGIQLSSGGTVDIGGAIDLQAGSGGVISDPAAILQGGSVTIAVATGGNLLAGGPLDAVVNAGAPQIFAGTARAGSINFTSAGIVAIGGTISLLGEARHSGVGTAGGNSVGGNIAVTMTGGSLSANGLAMAAVGTGGETSGNGGAGSGGDILVAMNGGARLTLVDRLSLTAGGFGGNADAGGTGGLGDAGTARVTVGGTGTQLLSSTGGFLVDALGGSAQGGGQGGAASAGTAELLISAGASAVFTGGFDMNADAVGGTVFGTGPGSGGAATAGTLQALVDGAGPGTLRLAPGGFVRLRADAFAGTVLNQGGAGGAGTGGTIRIGSTGNGGTVAIGDLFATVTAQGGDGGFSATPGDGGAAQGGSVTIGMGRDASAATAGNFEMASAIVDATAEGGGAGGLAASNGVATGGTVRLIINGGTGSVTGTVRLVSDAVAGVFPGVRAAGIGGRLEVGAADAANASAAGTLTLGGPVSLELSTAGSDDASPYTPGAMRLFASGAGSRLALQDTVTAENVADGSLPPGVAARSGIVAGVGARIDFASAVQFASRGDIGLNDGGIIAAAGDMVISSGGRVLSAFDLPTAGATGTVAAPRLEIAATAGINLATNTTGSTDVVLNSTAGRVQLLAIDANRDVFVNGATGIDFASLRADRTLSLVSAAGINGGTLSAGGRLTLDAGAGITTGAIDAGIVDPLAGVTPDAFVRAIGPISTGAVSSGGDIGLVAQGLLTSGALTSGRDLVLLAGGTITTGALATPATGRIRSGEFAQQSLITFPLGVPDYSALFAAATSTVPGNILITGNVTTGLFQARAAGLLRVTGSINAALGATLNATTLQLGSATSQGFLDLISVDSVVLGDLAAAGALSVTSNGSITTGNINAGQSLVLSATQPGAALSTGNIRANGEIRLSSATTLGTGSLSAGNRIFLNAGGAITTGGIDAGTVNPAQGASGVLFATSQATISTGSINVSGSATLSGVLGVRSGNVTAPGGIVLLDTGGISTGALTTSPAGFVYIAAHDLLPQITFDQAGNPQFAALLASTPVRLVGDVTIGGATSTGRFIAAATGNFTAQAITAPTGTLVDVGGLATLNGNITASTIGITAADIAIAPGVVVGGSSTSSINLVVDPAVRAAVIGGSGAATPGTYSLSNAEFGTLRADAIRVQMGAGPMTVEQLTLAALSPATGLATNQVNLVSGGVLRVTGAVAMAQAGAQNRLSLTSNSRVEVVQGSGSVRLGAGVDSPAGTLAITAPRLWVASDSVLGQLAGGQLSGQARDNALNTAGTPAVVGGSIGAGTILISAGNDVLVQNSGTSQLKAGFTTGTGGLRISRAGDGSAPIDVVINGRIQRADNSFAVNTDTVDLVQFVPGTAILTANSAVNGCIAGGICADTVPDEIGQPVLTIVNNVDALTPEELARREAARAASERLPLVVLQRLIDFGPLFADPDANDPVTSGGNPALWLDPAPRGAPMPGGQK